MRTRPVSSVTGVSCGPSTPTGFGNDWVAEVSTIIRAEAFERAYTSAPSARGSPLATP